MCLHAIEQTETAYMLFCDGASISSPPLWQAFDGFHNYHVSYISYISSNVVATLSVMHTALCRVRCASHAFYK